MFFKRADGKFLRILPSLPSAYLNDMCSPNIQLLSWEFPPCSLLSARLWACDCQEGCVFLLLSSVCLINQSVLVCKRGCVRACLLCCVSIWVKDLLVCFSISEFISVFICVFVTYLNHWACWAFKFSCVWSHMCVSVTSPPCLTVLL